MAATDKISMEKNSNMQTGRKKRLFEELDDDVPLAIDLGVISDIVPVPRDYGPIGCEVKEFRSLSRLTYGNEKSNVFASNQPLIGSSLAPQMPPSSNFKDATSKIFESGYSLRSSTPSVKGCYSHPNEMNACVSIPGETQQLVLPNRSNIDDAMKFQQQYNYKNALLHPQSRIRLSNGRYFKDFFESNM